MKRDDKMSSTETTANTAPIRTFKLQLEKPNVTVVLNSIGASITNLYLPSRKNPDDEAVDCVLHCHDCGEEQCKNEAYFGAVVGRVANRIANAKFELMNDGKMYELPANNGPNCLHGGTVGFSHLNFEAEQPSENSVKFTLISKDGDQGFPGTVLIKVIYTLEAVAVVQSKSKSSNSPNVADAELSVIMSAILLDDVGNAASPINLAQHTYFNLAGHDNEVGILDHTLAVQSKEFLPTDGNSIPTREVRSMNHDPAMDFRGDGRELHEALMDFGQKYCDYTSAEARNHIEKRRGLDKDGNPYGFDHNYVLSPNPNNIDGNNGGVGEVACLSHSPSGRTMRLFTSAPGMQVYTGNYLEGVDGKGGVKYKQWQGIALETQHYPDSIGAVSPEEFSKGACVIMASGSEVEDYQHEIKYQFGGLQ